MCCCRWWVNSLAVRAADWVSWRASCRWIVLAVERLAEEVAEWVLVVEAEVAEEEAALEEVEAVQVIIGLIDTLGSRFKVTFSIVYPAGGAAAGGGGTAASEHRKPVELLDIRCHVRLAEIAHSLLKVSPYDPESMACRGLQRYMQSILPRADWADDSLRNSLITILRRLDKVFLKICKKPSIRRNTDWEAAGGLLKGIHETIVRHPYVLHWTQIKALVVTVQNLIVNEPGGAPPEGVSSGAGAALMSQNPPLFFCSTVVRLISLQVVSTIEHITLEQICGGHSEFPTQEKAEGFLLHLMMPLCLKVCSGRGSECLLRGHKSVNRLLTCCSSSQLPIWAS